MPKKLGIRGTIAYGSRVIGFLRFVGILNAGVWLGATVFFTCGAGLAPFSPDMKNLLGANNYPYFSGAIAQILLKRFFYLQFICAALAVAHLVTERLYLGKHLQKFQTGLLAGLCAAVLLGGCWLQPKLQGLHAVKHGIHTRPEIRETAEHSFRTWHGVSQLVNVLLVGGLATYLWRVANPSDPTRFVSALKFTMR